MNVPCANRDDCRITFGQAFTRFNIHAPVYNGHGKRINSDTTQTEKSARCSRCMRAWMVTAGDDEQWEPIA